ncbi:hypothetical protein FOMPIDRAFT_1025005 [Fomitopsis schrenkii]|uniref:Uncharacterized protein n=1 Tax=Fomitopsis schrenkii TaxID=2126942 RepID=S8F7E4_FOMSC|nr:hypothetical protein FOMPIDRAFT_1025005 [Fomitopsis schrenkii]
MRALGKYDAASTQPVFKLKFKLGLSGILCYPPSVQVERRSVMPRQRVPLPRTIQLEALKISARTEVHNPI